MAFWLNNFEISFPHPKLADPDGLLAIGGDLQPMRLMLAYRNGIFPWYEIGENITWFSPDPRCVLLPGELKIQKSMRSIFNQKKLEFTADSCFEKVLENCAEVWRKDQIGTWITEKIVKAYLKLHDLGYAHSIEVWQSGELVGGLYGIHVGKVFCGESMFSLIPNASKAGFITLVQALEKAGFWLIDCQVETPHLASLGARNFPRDEFLEVLAKNRFEKTVQEKWHFDENLNLPVLFQNH